MAKEKQVWNVSGFTKTLTLSDAKGTPYRHDVVGPLEDITVPEAEWPRLEADGGWADKRPQELVEATKIAKEMRAAEERRMKQLEAAAKKEAG